MANVINTIVSTIKSAGRTANNLLQVVEVGSHYAEGISAEAKDTVGKTPEEAYQKGIEHTKLVKSKIKEGAKSIKDTFSME